MTIKQEALTFQLFLFRVKLQPIPVPLTRWLSLKMLLLLLDVTSALLHMVGMGAASSTLTTAGRIMNMSSLWQCVLRVARMWSLVALTSKLN